MFCMGRNMGRLGVSFLVLVMFLALAQGIGCSAESSKSTASDKQISAQKDHKVVVTYFHGNRRCFSCKKIEALTIAAIKEGFSREIEKGLLEFKLVNVDDRGNKHFIDKYKLYSQSVIVSDVVKGREEKWKNLDQVWQLLYREDVFKAYIQEEVREYLDRKAS